jgi:hypothetical protein
MIAPALRRLSSVLVAAQMVGCFYYDSTWGQKQAEEKRAAARLKPATLEHRAVPHDGMRLARVRAHATRAYAAETLDWEVSFRELLRDASAVLEPSLGITLEDGGASLWQPSGDEASLGPMLQELADEDEGRDAEWVVGFVQSTPKLVTDYHVLGMGRPLSKYLVLRASNDPAEHDFIGREFGGMSEAQKEQLYSERKHHRMVTVFLHELGHTLGALHRVGVTTIMSPAYDPRASGFDAATLGLLRITVPLRFEGPNSRASYGELLTYVRDHPDGWAADERDALMRSLTSTAESLPTPPAAATSAPPPPMTPRDLDALTSDERARYDKAIAIEPSDSSTAWLLAGPLFESHPDVVPVQVLRCRLAHERRFYPAVVAAHCSRLDVLKQTP